MLLHFSTEEKKSLLYTAIITVSVLLILVYIRFMNTADTIEDFAGGGGGGVEINFGDSDWGAGADFTSEVLNVTESSNRSVAAVPEFQEEILAQENTTEKTDVSVIRKPQTDTKIKPKTQPATNPVTQKNKVSDNTNSALSSILSGNTKGGDGVTGRAGNQGKQDGSLSSDNYYGDGGSGGGSGGGHGTGKGTGIGAGEGTGTGGGVGYSLAGRKAVSKPAPKNNCNQAGKVVVRVLVDRNGNVVKAEPGVKGTTNNSGCLLNIAKTAALNTKWESKPSAPNEQEGTIVYNFTWKGN